MQGKVESIKTDEMGNIAFTELGIGDNTLMDDKGGPVTSRTGFMLVTQNMYTHVIVYVHA